MKKTLSIICLIITFFIIYFLQSNFFTWFTIAGIMPNLYVILVLFIGLFVKRKLGLVLGLIFGLYLDIVLGRVVGISALGLGLIGLLGEILSKNFSKDSRFIVTLMVIITTAIYEILVYICSMLRLSADIEIIPFLKILVIEIIFSISCFLKIVQYGSNNVSLFDDKFMLTRYF